MLSMAWARNLDALSMEYRAPSLGDVMQAILRRPRSSSSLAYSITAHCRQEPTEPMLGCQQKYGKSSPWESTSSSRFLLSSTSRTLPSTVIFTIYHSDKINTYNKL